MQQNRDRNGRPRNTRPYDLNRDVARTSAPSQDHTPRSTGSSRYGYNGEPLSRPPSRSANGSVRSSRADNSTTPVTTRRAADPKTRSPAASSAARQTMPVAGRAAGKTRTRKTARTGSTRQAARAPRSKALPGGKCAKSAR